MARGPLLATSRSCLALVFCCCCCFSRLPQAIAGAPPPSALPRESPVKRVIGLLQSLKAKVEVHSKNEGRLFDQFVCYCKKTRAELYKSLDSAKEKKPLLESTLQETQAAVTILETDIKVHKQNMEAAKTALSEQKSLRADRKAGVEKEDAEMTANIQSLREAVAALSAAKAQDGDALLQSGAAAPIQAFAQSINPDRLRPQDREALASLLQQLDEGSGGDEGDASLGPGGSQILGILQQMSDDMVADLDSLRKDFERSDAQAEALAAAKGREAETLRTTIEDKLTRLGSQKVRLAELKSDIMATEGSLKEDGNLLATTDKECQSRVNNHNKMASELAAEISAISHAIEVLASQSAAQTFMKADATSSPVTFVQVAAKRASGSKEDPVQQAVLELRMLSEGSPGKGKFSVLARHAARASRHRSPAGVEKIITLVDQMLVLLVKEQEDDDLKKQMCEAEMEREVKHKKSVDEELQKRELGSQTAQTDHDAVVADIAGIRNDIEDRDKSVAEATEQRKLEHDALVQVLADTNAAISLIRKAKLHLMRYYERFDLIQEEQQKNAEALAQTKEASGDSDDFGFLAESGVSSSSASSDSAAADAGRVAKRFVEDINKFMGDIEEDLKREAQQARSDDEDAQSEYEELMKNSEHKRAQDAKSVTYKAGVMAEAAETIRTINKKAKALRGDAEQSAKVIADLQDDCGWLLKNHAERKQARTAEHDALERTTAILHGASYGLAQVKKHQGH